jgi:hypothetical protein
MLQSAGLEALKGKVIGGGVQQAAAQQASNLAFQQAAAQNMAGGLANPMSQMGAKFLANSPPLAKPFGAETLLADTSNKILPKSLVNAQGEIGGTVSTPWGGVQSYQYGNFPAGSPLHAGTVTPTVTPTVTSTVTPTVTSTVTPTVTPTASPYDLSAGFRQGIDPRFAGQQSLQVSTSPTVNATDIVGKGIRPNQNFLQNLGNIGSFQDVKDYVEQHPYATAAGAYGLYKALEQDGVKAPESNAMIRPYTYDRSQRPEAYAVSPTQDSSERLYFNDQFIAGEPYKAAGGGVVSLATGGPVEQMSAMNAIGANTGYPMANINSPMYSNPMMQRPEATNVIAPSADAGVGAYSGEQRFAKGGETETEGGYSYSFDPQTLQFTQLSVPTIKPPATTFVGMNPPINVAPTPQPIKNPGTKVSGGIATPAMGPMQSQQATPINIPAYQSPEQQLGLEGFYDMMNQRLAGYGGYAGYAKGGNVGGISHLGDYSDGGRLLKGPGDGVSDSIPASIGGRQPARLADGEFVVPARIVSELGNGSTEAGARKLYAMMDRIQKGRRKSVGKGKVAVNSKSDKYLPA